MDQTQFLFVVGGMFLLLVVAGSGLYVSILVKNLLESLLQSQRQTLNDLPKAFTDVAGQELSKKVAPIVQEVGGLSDSVGNLLTTLTDSLQSSEAQFKEANQVMSENASEIRQLRAALDESHTQFQQVVMTLAEPGTLQEWVQQLSLAVQPLHEVQARLDEYYHTNGSLVQSTEKLLTQWYGQHDTVARSSQQIATSLERWASGEMAKRNEFERHIRQYLKETGEKSQLLAGHLGDLQSEVHRLASAIANLETTSNNAVTAVNRLIDLQKMVATDQQEVVNRLNQVATHLAEQQEGLSHKLGVVAHEVDTIGQSTRTWQEAIQQQVQLQLAEMGTSFQTTLQNFHTSHEQVLATLQNQNQQLIGDQRNALRQLLANMTELPKAQEQKKQNLLLSILLAVQVITLLLLGVAIYVN